MTVKFIVPAAWGFNSALYAARSKVLPEGEWFRDCIPDLLTSKFAGLSLFKSCSEGAEEIRLICDAGTGVLKRAA